jgi:hypothetical protein
MMKDPKVEKKPLNEGVERRGGKNPPPQNPKPNNPPPAQKPKE